MPNFNYYLDADVEIGKANLIAISEDVSEIKDDDHSFLSDPVTSKWTKKQLKVLRVVLCNLVKYQRIPILYDRRNDKTTAERYNPQLIGNKVLKEVIDKLADSNCIMHIKGQNSWKIANAKKSEFLGFLEIAQSRRTMLFYTKGLLSGKLPFPEI